MTNQLAGFASLPADTLAEGTPAGGNDGEGNPIDANGRTGSFDGQPVQGFSGVQFAPDNTGALWFLSDNGFGSKENSTDYLLRIYQVDPNFTGIEDGDGSVEIETFIQLADPDNLIPFDIVNEDSEERLLTGGDFDIESFVIDENGDIWVGDEFGPYLLHFNSEGELLEAPIATPNITNLNTLNGQDPLVIAHRGASGLLPEHTLEAYATAIAQGADFIEPDLVTTKDGVLIARHEPLLDDTTNVAEVFGEDRQSTKILDGEEITGYFAEDFTLEEIKQLRGVQSRDFRSQDFNGAFEIPTFEEVIQLVQETEAETGVKVGIYPETKHPTFFDLQDLSLEEPLIQTLIDTGFTAPERIFIQSFEFQNLIELQGMLDAEGLGDIPLVQLYGDTTASASADDGFSVPYDIRYNLEQGNDLAEIYGQDFVDAVENGLSENTTYRDLDSAEFLQIISDKYAEGAGPWKNNILLREELEEPVDADGDGEGEITTQLTGEITSFVDDAHAAGLQVHPYTHRNEERFLTLDGSGNPQTPEEEIQQYIEVGFDGFFTDFPATGVAVVDSVTGELVRSPQNPDLGDDLANLARSQGFEGMAFSPDRSTLYPLLEGTVDGDPQDALRIYEFDVESANFNGLVGYYPTTDSNPIGDFTPINDTEFLVIERDNNEAEEAQFKKIFKIDISQVDENGFVAKEEVVDLLNLADPNDFNGDGETTYSMPFVTIEDVVVVDEDTILVANDNNYPFSMGREGDIDNNEIVLIDLEQPLNLDSNLGGTSLTSKPIPNRGDTEQPAQMTGLNGYEVDPIFTIGEEFNGYTPPGILDGLGAYSFDDDTVRVFANHELTPDVGYTYSLANGTELTGARVSFFDLNTETQELEDAGLAYDTIINHAGEEVDEAEDLEFEGINRLCSAQYIEAHQFGEGRGIEDSLFFTGEETDGGTEFVIDPASNTMYAVPWMGRAAWESVTELDTGTTERVAFLVGDDREAAPLLMYVGEKDTSEGASLLERNGLVGGKLYTWAPDSDVADTPTFTDEDGEPVDEDDAPDPAGFSGTGNSQAGSWVELDYYRPDLAGTAVDTDDDEDIQDELGYDEQGFATQAQQDELFVTAGGFQFSRPEDLATNPEDGTQAVLASTGRGGRYEGDNWGSTYLIDTEFDQSGNPVSAQLDILYDGDDAGNGQFEHPDFGLRSPDNLEWADNGKILIQEDRSTFADQNLTVDEQDAATFGAISGEEASIWELDPETAELTRVAQMDRSAIPEGQTDNDPDDIGEWESSGIIDVSDLFGDEPGTRFIFDVQAHSLEDGIIAESELVQGGQLAFLKKEEESEPEVATAKVESGTTSVFLDLPLLESAAGLTLTGADSSGEPFSDDFQVGFPITEDTNFTYEIPFAPVDGSIEHSGTVTFGLGDGEVTLGDFSIGFDSARVSETTSGFFVADTLDDDLGLEILFDVGVPGEVGATSEELTIAEADLLLAPEFAEALELSDLAGADVGDTRIDAAAIPVEVVPESEGNSVIFIHPDGTSPSHYAAGRFASVGPDGRLNWDEMTNAGVYLGHMDDQVVATSNGGAVVHAFGIKSHAGSYGLDEEGNPYTSLSDQEGTTIMEEAIAEGKATAVINSGFIAEPGTGVFLAEAENRNDVTGITAEIVESGVNVIMGGGEIHYLPKGNIGRFGEEGIREDGRNLIEEAEAMGYTVVYTREELESLPADTEKVLGIFAAEDTYNDLPEGALTEEGFVDENGELILYGQPGNENPPTVAEMLETTLGLEAFSDNENGMFVVLEEEGTDNFGNNNNAAGTVEAVLRADAAIGVAQDYIDNVNPDTLLITAADSDGGGLEVDDVEGETVGTTAIQPPLETEIPYDGTTGNDTAPFVTGAPDANGDTFDFGVAWSGVPDVAGSIVSKTYGLNAEKLPGTIDNTGIYRLMYETLFDEELAPPEGVPDDFGITPPPEPTQDTGNVIFIHPDGTSPSHYAAARFVSEGTDGRLNWDNMTDAGVYLGHIDDRLVSTSNAGAVVHAFGTKPFAGSYGLDEEGNPITSLSGQEGTTILEEAIAAGKPTAVINSGFIAEPGTGVFLADAEDRSNVAEITAEIVESGADVIMGGGEIHYLPKGTVGRFGEEGIREDGRNLIEEAQQMGYTVVYTREELENLPADAEKVLGIFAAEDTYNDNDEATLKEEGFVDENGELILYGQPGNETPPTVAEMLDKTLSFNKFANAENGFMVVLEEEGSDNFPNNNNGAGALEATLRADAAIGVAQDFVNHVDPNTLVLTAADSDAGGLEVIDVDKESKTVGNISVQPELAAFGDDADGIPVPLDGTTGNDTEPFTTGAPDADGDSFEFGVGYVSTNDVAGSIVSKGYGLNSELLEDTVDNTDMYRIMYQTLFGTAPEEVVEESDIIDFTSFTAQVSATNGAVFNHIGGFYQAIDTEGTVIDPLNGAEIAVGDEGYEAAALANSVVEIGDGETATLDFDGGFVYVPYLLADGVEFYSAFADANSDGFDHVQSVEENVFGFEDLLGGSDSDFNDFVISFEVA